MDGLKKISIFISAALTTIVVICLIGWFIVYSQLFQSEQLYKSFEHTKTFSPYQTEFKEIEEKFWENIKANEKIHKNIIQNELPQLEEAKQWDNYLLTIENVLAPMYRINQYWLWIFLSIIAWNVGALFLLKWDELEFDYMKTVCKNIAWVLFAFISFGFVLYTSRFFLQMPTDIQTVYAEICKTTIYILFFFELPILLLGFFSYFKIHTREKK